MIHFIVPGIPPSMNKYAGRQNCWAYRNDKKEWEQRIFFCVHSSRPRTPFKYADIELHYFFPTRARHDADNYAGKFILDGLREAGVIEDDDLMHITTTIKGGYDKQRPRVEITVRERDNIEL